jgi:hypothetical protein
VSAHASRFKKFLNCSAQCENYFCNCTRVVQYGGIILLDYLPSEPLGIYIARKSLTKAVTEVNDVGNIKTLPVGNYAIRVEKTPVHYFMQWYSI